MIYFIYYKTFFIFFNSTYMFKYNQYFDIINYLIQWN